MTVSELIKLLQTLEQDWQVEYNFFESFEEISGVQVDEESKKYILT